ncbi:MAG TPA: hypothetical protein VL086_03050 [Candidatus Nitrosotalea sp.]|nr:hypothetical protein [Candidatus Nitrosotalea sp.]
MPQMLLYSAQIAAGSPQQLYAARMPKRMRMKLGEPCLLTQSLDHLEDPVVSHALLTPPSAFDLESHDEERLGGRRTRTLRSQVLHVPSSIPRTIRSQGVSSS